MTRPHHRFSFGCPLWVSVSAQRVWTRNAVRAGRDARKGSEQRRSCVLKIPCSVLDAAGKLKRLKLLLSYKGIPSKIISEFWKSVNVTVANSQTASLSSC